MHDQDPWHEIVDGLLKVAVQSRSAGRLGKGSIDDAVQSAIASGLAKEDCPSLEDPMIYDFLRTALLRKLDTYRHHYRNGQGQTGLESQIADDEGDLFSLFADLNRIAPDDALDPPPIDQFITRPMVEHCMNWVKKQIESLPDPVQQDVAGLWIEGCSIEQTESILGISNHTVKMARRAIKSELRKRASE